MELSGGFKNQIVFTFLLAKCWMLVAGLPACRMSEVGEAWLLLASCCDDKNARSLSLSVHRAGTTIFTEISRFHGPAFAEKLALSVAIPCCPPCPCLWKSFRKEHLRACLLYVHAVIVLCGSLLSLVLCDEIFKT